MSEIRIKRVVEFSSEDAVFRAENLVSGSSGKWIGAKDGEIKQYVVLELERAAPIHQVSVENESSAFVEVRVGGADAQVSDESDDFEVLLAAAAFMTPSESKNRLNANRLKVFTSEAGDLDKDIARRKSQRIHVICTQSFNPNIQFGLSSIKFYDKVLSEPAEIKTGSFSLKKEASLEKKETTTATTIEIKAGSFFRAAKSTAAVVDEDEDKATKKSSTTTTTTTATAANSNYFLNLKRKAEASASDDEPEKPTTTKISMTGNARLKEDKSERKPASFKAAAPEQVLKGVVFALSGFQNPLRSELRDTGLKLGAKYRPDWTDDCTHLVCAFSNTPKAAQVRKEGGTIVTKEWIYACEKKQKRLDCDDFEVPEPASDDSDSDVDAEKPRKAAKNAVKKISKLKRKDEYDDSYDEEEAENSDDRDFIVGSSEDDDEEVSADEPSESEESEESMDSDDSERVTSKKRKKGSKKTGGSSKKANKKKPAKKSSPKKQKKKVASSDSESDDDDDIEAYKKKREKELKAKKPVKKSVKSDSDDEEEKDSAKAKKSSKKSDSEDEDSTKSKAKAAGKKKAAKSPERSNTTETNSDLDEPEAAPAKADKKKKKDTADSDEWELPAFFDGKEFYVYGDFAEKKLRNMKRQVVAFSGNLNNYMSDDIDYVITDKKWNKEFAKAKKDNKKLVIVNDDWLEACTKRKKLVAHQPYEVKDD